MSSTTSHDRPNILVITTHDSGRYFGCYGIDELRTPAIDALAADGVCFTRYFATVPICSASRATMLTGRYPQSHGLMDLVHPNAGWKLGDDERHLSHLLRDAGYGTYLFGMQHEAWDVNTLGFDETHAQHASGGGRQFAGEVAESVAEFLASSAQDTSPFYAQVGFVETHTPFAREHIEPDDSNSVYIPPYVQPDGPMRQTMAEFQGMLRTVDDAVRTIVDALAASGLEEDTLLVFTTDHGIELPRSKWFLYDPGVEIALVMRWPGGGIDGGRTCDHLLANVDFVPSVLELAGMTVPENIEGVSFAANLADDAAEAPRDAVFGMYQKFDIRSVRTDDFKLIQHFNFPTDYLELPVASDMQMQKRVIPMVELFDLRTDPNEFNNVSDDPAYADVRDELLDRLWRWLEFVDDPILRGPVRTPSYEQAHGDYVAWKDGVSRKDAKNG